MREIGSSGWPLFFLVREGGERAATKTPFACVHYYPGMLPSREVPPVGLPAWRWLNPVSWALFGSLIDLGFRKPASRFFASKGLPKVRSAMRDVLMSDQLNLVASSPTLFPTPADWAGLNVHRGDFTFPPSDEAWAPSGELKAFLEAGEKPVLVSFGTLEHLAPERARDLAVAAVRAAGVRAILQTKCGTERGEGRDGPIFFARWAPHRHLLPRCSAMVLHGGAGTVHAALRSGLPGVVVPFIFEQRLWGNLLHRAGSATAPLSFWKANPESLGARIREAVHSDAMRLRAAQLAQAVAREDGVGEAVRAVETTFCS